ncbi:MAG: Hsp20 family protein [Planctomycetota bacterium]
MKPVLYRDLFDDTADSLRRDLFRLIEPLGFGRPANGGEGAVSYPCDVHETEDAYAIEAELPGFTREQIKVTLREGVLGIAADRSEAAEQTRENGEWGQPHLRERTHTRIRRSFRLPGMVDEGGVDAELKDGVLHVRVPKQRVASREIAIR